MTRRTGLVAGLAVAACTLVGALLWFAADDRSQPPTYNQVRKQLIDRARREPMPRPAQPPTRPANLDTRLPAGTADELAQLVPITEANGLAFYTVFGRILQSLIDELRAIDRSNDWPELLSPARRAVVLTEAVERDLVEGSFEIYYRSPSGDGARLAPEALRRMGQERLAILVEKGNQVFRDDLPVDRVHRLHAIERLGDAALRAWKDLDAQVRALPLPPGGITVAGGPALILKNRHEFFKDH